MLERNTPLTQLLNLRCVTCAKSTTNRGAAANLFVDEKSVREWRKQKDSLLALPNKKRIHRGGQKASNPCRHGGSISGVDQ